MRPFEVKIEGTYPRRLLGDVHALAQEWIGPRPFVVLVDTGMGERRLTPRNGIDDADGCFAVALARMLKAQRLES